MPRANHSTTAAGSKRSTAFLRLRSGQALSSNSSKRLNAKARQYGTLRFENFRDARPTPLLALGFRGEAKGTHGVTRVGPRQLVDFTK